MQVESELDTIRAQTDSEVAARRALEARHAKLLSDVDGQARQLESALAQATSKTREADILSLQLEQLRSEVVETKRLQAQTDERINKVLTDQADTLRSLEEARSRGEDLEVQIRAARTEGDEASRALKEATREKDRLLRAQALDAERSLRDHIAEADGDRAVLEHQFSELRAKQDTTERELQEALMENDISRADSAGLREELQRAHHELYEAQKVEDDLRTELVHLRSQLEDQFQAYKSSEDLVADLLHLAVTFRDTNAKLLSATQKSLSHGLKPRKVSAAADDEMALSMRLPLSASMEGDTTRTTEVLETYTSPIDWSDPVTAVEILRRFDLDAFSETILKSGTTIRKWQKQCRDYRDRAKGKISFRNFSKGDLALFLPTRNSVAKPWAAFNGALYML